jgi:hypothetical protein
MVSTLIPYTQAELNTKFDTDGWASRLAGCQSAQIEDQEWAPVPGRINVQKRGRKYFDDDGNTMAVIMEYRHADGTLHRAVRMLREGDDIHYVV